MAVETILSGRIGFLHEKDYLTGSHRGLEVNRRSPQRFGGKFVRQGLFLRIELGSC